MTFPNLCPVFFYYTPILRVFRNICSFSSANRNAIFYARRAANDPWDTFPSARRVASGSWDTFPSARRDASGSWDTFPSALFFPRQIIFILRQKKSKEINFCLTLFVWRNKYCPICLAQQILISFDFFCWSQNSGASSPVAIGAAHAILERRAARISLQEA